MQHSGACYEGNCRVKRRHGPLPGRALKSLPRPFLEEHAVVLGQHGWLSRRLLLPGPLSDNSAGPRLGSFLGSPRNEEGTAAVRGSSSGSHRVWGTRRQVLCDPELQGQPELQRPGRRVRSGAGPGPPTRSSPSGPQMGPTFSSPWLGRVFWRLGCPLSLRVGRV